MALSWGARRQLLYMGFLAIIGLAILAYIFVPKILTKPTCSDGKKNGAESGIDCGGECKNICSFESTPLSVIWARSFLTSGNIYNAVAYVENRNPDGIAKGAHYQFKIFDAQDILITSQEGEADIPPAGRYPIFLGGIDMGNRRPVRTKFEFIGGAPAWMHAGAPAVDLLHSVLAKNPDLVDISTSPKLHATLENNSLYNLSDIKVVALLADESNVFAVSSTFVNNLSARSSKDIYFNWPIPFANAPLHTDLIPLFDLLDVDYSKDASRSN